MTTHQFQPLLMSYPIRSQMVTAVPSSPSSQSTGFVQPTVQMTPVQSIPSSMTNIQQPQSQHQNFNLQLQNIQFCPAAIRHPFGPQFDPSMPIPFVPVNNHNQPIFIGSPEYHPVMNQPALLPHPPPMTNLMSSEAGSYPPFAFPSAAAAGSCPPNMTYEYVSGHLVPATPEEIHKFISGQLPTVGSHGYPVQGGHSYVDLTQSLCPPPPPFSCGNFVNPMMMMQSAAVGPHPPFVGMGGWPIGGNFLVPPTKEQGHSPSKKHTRSFSERKNVCGFCKSNRESREVYKSHRLKKETGEVECPVLRKYICPYCQETGDKAHTQSYCPLKPNAPEAGPQGNVTVEHRLVRNSTGKRYMLKF